MATTRFSINPSSPMHTVVQAVGAATVTTPIEVTIDFAALQASAISATQMRLQAKTGLDKICEYIENTSKFTLPG